MPELFSRMDNLNWLTPAIAEILDQGSKPPGGDGSIRERMLMIQRELDELDTPARIVNVRSTPSYTLYIARPENIGRLTNRRTVSSEEIKQSLKVISENHKDWLLGFMPQLRDDDSAVGILLRTDQHRPISLRRLLVRSIFRKHPSTLAFVLGITLEQQLIVDSIDEVGHILVVGADNAKQHFIRSTLLSLIMLNTPSELRVAIAGEGSNAYKYIVGAPHALGRILTSPSEGQRLIDGLVKEIQRRQQSFSDEGTTNIVNYNNLAKQQGKAELPRIVLILDSLTDSTWRSQATKWLASLSELLVKGSKVGIHLIITVDDENNLDLSSTILNELRLRVVTRTASKDIGTSIPNFHASLLRFVDAFVINKGEQNDDQITPVELCAISNAEIKNVVEYWRQMSKQRYQDIQASTASNKTGITGVLTPPPELDRESATPPTPPTPEKPSVSTLTRATQAIETQITTRSEPSTDVKKPSEEIPAVTVKSDHDTTIQETETQETEQTSLDSVIIHQATALSAYLGWINQEALCNILNVSTEQANEILDQLQQQHIVEEASYPTLRFVRKEPPN